MIDHKAALGLAELSTSSSDGLGIKRLPVPNAYLDLRRLVIEYFDELESIEIEGDRPFDKLYEIKDALRAAIGEEK